ncbi:transcriptional regulator [Lactococcus hodotermopsidis]|uniref:Transcriptional regulator n=1 Tax=Pseudolactococcus hodotermopsidis TaxID=2709157 RepID=A0A6A0BD97_9LACT|nr:AsnC family transcriptional regulator [Lactococcus hodotermopsidis]GFH42434.1 transcriptional regulator [Lactococcus hodotermopsidis]
MKGFILDKIDKKILRLLQRDSRLTNKAIGEQIHMTGQAVGLRIRKMLDESIIENYTISIKHPNKQFIRIFMANNRFNEFENVVNTFEEIDDFYKISGQACYIVIAHFTTENLSKFIERISNWGRYSVETVVSDKKKG